MIGKGLLLGEHRLDAQGQRVMLGKRPIGRLGSPQVRHWCDDPRGELYRYPGYAFGRPEFFYAPRVPLSTLAAVEAGSGSRKEAIGTYDP